LVSSGGTTVRRGNLVVARAFSFRVVVVAGANESLVLRCLGEGWSKLPSSLDAMRNPSVESSILARCEIDAWLRVEPMKVAPLLPLLGERLRPPK
jgi:hypothetical protein